MARVWFPPSETRRSWNAAFATRERLRVFDRLLLLVDQAAQLGDGAAPAALGRDRLGGERLEQRARFEHVGERHVARPQDQRRGARGHALVRFVDDHPAVDAADDGDEPFGFEDAQRLAQRRTRDTESFDELRLTADRLAFRELAADDQRPQLVGDLLRLLAKLGPVALARSHLNHPASQGRNI